MDEATNPRTVPEVYDRFFLDGEPCPGISEITSGGEAAAKIEGMQALGEVGATTVDRGDELGGVTYRVDVWAGSQLAETGSWLKKLRAAQKRPYGGRRKVLELVDLRLEHNDLDRVIVEKVGPLRLTAPGKWSVEVSFKQWRPRVARGGPVRPRNAELDAANRAEQQASADLAQAADALGKALDKAGG